MVLGQAMKPADRPLELNRRKAQSRLTASALRVITALKPILARLPCRSDRTVEGRYAFLPTPTEMQEARGALFDLASAIEKQ
jgi:hypothetical protein